MTSFSIRAKPTSQHNLLTSDTSKVTPGRTLDDDDDDDNDDLDPAAFLKSVRELSEKREREDNERYRKLEEEVVKGRQERLARRAEYARSISPEKRVGTPTHSSHTSPRPRGSTDTYTNSPTPSARSSTSKMGEQQLPSSSGSSAKVESVPEFKGFGSARKTSSSDAHQSTHTSDTSPSASPTPASRASPSAAMPSRSGTMKWQQRPQSRGGTTRPLSAVAAENNANAQIQAQSRAGSSPERSREDIASALGSKDPSWFRQTAERGVGNAALRKSKDEIPHDTGRGSGKQELPGMMDSATESTMPLEARSSSHSVTSEQGPSLARGALANRDTTAQVSNHSQSESRTASVLDGNSSIPESRNSSSTVASVQARLSKGSSRSPSPTKDMGGFVQSTMLKRSDSINKRSNAQSSFTAGQVDQVRTGYGGLQGSHSMPKLERPDKDTQTTDSLVRPMSGLDLTNAGSTGLTRSQESSNAHARHRSITSAYTTNDYEPTTSAPSSPSKRWSPNKSSWIESALTAKQEPRSPSPAKNLQPAWMTSLAKARAERGQSDEHRQQPSPAAQSLGPTKDASGVLTHPTKTLTQDVQSHKKEKDSADANALGIEMESPVKRVESAPQPVNASAGATYRTESDAGPKLKAVKTMGHIDTKQKPHVSPKPHIDLHATLRSRAAAEIHSHEQPEFLARFGSLRKATTEKYVAPDVLKNNILRGKAALTVTGGPQKTERRDEFKESIQAKKEEWRREKEEGVVHVHKTSAPLVSPKPEALAQREALSRTGTNGVPTSPTKEKPTTPEALRRHQSIRTKQGSEDAKPIKATPQFAIKGADKLASRMDPQLASMLARGRSTVNNESMTSAGKVESSAGETTITTSTSTSIEEAGQLQDLRKGRAKGPKRRKGGPTQVEDNKSDVLIGSASDEQKAETPVVAVAAVAKPMSAASIMTASLGKSSNSIPLSTTAAKLSSISPPVGSGEPGLSSDDTIATRPTQNTQQRDASPSKNVPQFAGFGKRSQNETLTKEDDKENRASDLSFLPSVRSITANQSRRTAPEQISRPPQIKMPSKKDEEAAMRSAGLLAAASPSASSFDPRDSQASVANSERPPKPGKSSRAVSGQLQEASPNKEIAVRVPVSEVQETLISTFGSIPQQVTQQKIKLPEAVTETDGSDFQRTLHREVYELEPDSARPRKLCGADEYVLYEQSIVVVLHVYLTVNGTQSTVIYVWMGCDASHVDVSVANETAQAMARNNRGTSIQNVRQGHEDANFLQAIGGILVSRRGIRHARPSTFMLCCRKHLGHIVLDEVDVQSRTICGAFIYLMSHAPAGSNPILYLWKGAASLTEELCAGRLVATDVSRDGHYVEVHDGDEPQDFLDALEEPDLRPGFASSPLALNRREEMPGRFAVRLLRIHADNTKHGLFTGLFARRPSWSSQSRGDSESTPRISVREVSPFTQEDLEVDGLYILDAFSQIYLLIGPLFGDSHQGGLGEKMFVQALHVCEECGHRYTGSGGRVDAPTMVVFRGVPEEMRFLFRRWKDGHNLWSTPGLMAGSDHDGSSLVVFALGELLDAIQWSTCV